MPFTTSKNVRNLLNKFNPMYRKNHRELEEMSKEDLINYVDKLHDEIRTTQHVYYHSGVHEGKRCFAGDLWAHKQGILAFDTERKYSTNKGPNWDKRKELGWEAQLEEKCIKHSNQSVDETSGITIFNILQENDKYEDKIFDLENEIVDQDVKICNLKIDLEEKESYVKLYEKIKNERDDSLIENEELWDENKKLKDEIITLHETS